MMSFLSAIVTSCYPTTNNQLRNLSNPRQQATINDGRVTLQLVQGRQISFATGTTRTYTPGASGSNLWETKDWIKCCWYKLKNWSNFFYGGGTSIFGRSRTAGRSSHTDCSLLTMLLNQADDLDDYDFNFVELQTLPKCAGDCRLLNSRVVSEIVVFKQTLSEHLKEKESLMQTVTLLKNDFKEEESRNIDIKIALEKKIKQMDNIVYKRDQLAQTVHMLRKPQFFFDHTTKQALGFQNPFYLKKAQQLEPKLYNGNVIKNTSAIVIPDSEETLLLAEDSHFEKQFVPQTELSAKQAFWSQNSMNSSNHSPSCRPTKVEVPKELPKVSMVNTSLKKLKHYLAGFDVVVKERTTTTTITKGSWGFKHIKACFRDEIISFVKALKDIFNTFDQYLIDELFEVQNVFHQMEQDVEQHQVINKDIVNIIMNSTMDNAYVNVHECEKCLKLETGLLNKKDFIEKETYDKLFRSYTTLEKHCIYLEVDTHLNQEIFQRDNSVSNQSALNFDQYFKLNELKAQSQEKDTVIRKLKERIKSLSRNMNEDKVKKDIEEIETKNIELEHRVSKLIAENDHLKQTYKQLYIKPTRTRSKEQCDALVSEVNQKSVEISDLNVSLQEKDLVITALKNELRKLKGKDLADNVVTKHPITPEMLKVDIEPIAPKLLNNRTTHSYYIKHTQE
ncbi:hypothetical protein Tco_0756827 [Tanacetum coccineum]